MITDKEGQPPMVTQTVKYATLRATADPDRTPTEHGTYYGNNLPNRYSQATDWGHRYATTRGAWRKRITH